MEYRTLATTEYRLSNLGLACWAIGPDGLPPEPVDFNEAIATVQAALELGITCLEVTPSPAALATEELLSKAIQSQRARVVLAVPCTAAQAPQHGADGRLTCKAEIIAACSASLRRLRLDRIDLYFAHWPDVAAPLPDLMAAMQELLQHGDIGAIGLSHFGCEKLIEARRLGPVHVVRGALGVLDRDSSADLQAYGRTHGLVFLAANPLYGGLLTRRYSRQAGLADVRADSAGSVRPLRGPDDWAVSQLSELADGLGRTTAQLALAWTLAQPGVTTVAVGAARPTQIREYARAVDWKLTPEAAARIDEILAERDRQLER